MPVLVLDEKIDVDPDLVDGLDIYLLEAFHQLDLVDLFLERVKSEVESLVFANDRAPKVQDLVHGVLLESRETHDLLDAVWLSLQELLAVVRLREQLWYLRSSPANMDLLRRVRLVAIVHVFQVGEILHSVLELLGLKAVGRHDNQVDLVLFQHGLESLFVVGMLLSLFDLSGSKRGSLAVFVGLWLPRWDQIAEIFAHNEISVLVDYGNRNLVGSAVDLRKLGPHDVESGSLRNLVNLLAVLERFLLLKLVFLIVLEYLLLVHFVLDVDFEISLLDQVLILLRALPYDIALGVLSQLNFDLVDDALQEGHTLRGTLGGKGAAENPEYLSSRNLPLAGVVRRLEHLEHALEVLAADALVCLVLGHLIGIPLALARYCVGNEAKSIVL